MLTNTTHSDTPSTKGVIHMANQIDRMVRQFRNRRGKIRFMIVVPAVDTTTGIRKLKTLDRYNQRSDLAQIKPKLTLVEEVDENNTT